MKLPQRQQYGIQLAGAREPIYVVSNCQTLAVFRDWLIGNGPLCTVQLVGTRGASAVVGILHIVAVSGPNNPHVTELFKR